MITLELPKEKMIEIVIDHKKNIVKTTNQISESLQKLREPTSKKMSLDYETALFVKKSVHQVVSDLSIIGGFCGGTEKDYINRMAFMLGGLVATGYIDIVTAPIIELWCTMVNSIMIDFNKTPFRFVGGEFKLNLRKLETKIKAFLSREKIAQKS